MAVSRPTPEGGTAAVMGSRRALREATVGLRRTLGPLDGAALVIANVIGVGIFTTPGMVAGMVSSHTIIIR